MRLPRPLCCAFVVALALTMLGAPVAHADHLNPAESARLGRGETVIREQTWEPSSSAHYVGGLTYTIVDASAPEMYGILEDVQSYRRLLPLTKRVKLVSVEPNGDRLVELVHGNALMEAEYTLRVRQYPARREVRFWLETSRPHEIDDAFGYFRVESVESRTGTPKVLLTYAILVDVGPGIVRNMFEEKVRARLLSVPQLVRRYVAEVRHP
jgi:hypothetical protein